MISNHFAALLDRLTTPATVSAHCDLPCGVYDPAQARLEAQSVKACMEKYNASSDNDFKVRATTIKEERCELVKHHLWVLWTDYFKAPHFEKYPQLNGLFNEATKLAGAGGTKGSLDVAVADPRGDVRTIRNAICMHEEDFGILWKHVDETGHAEVRRSRRFFPNRKD